jgi:hypothetical protein
MAREENLAADWEKASGGRYKKKARNRTPVFANYCEDLFA